MSTGDTNWDILKRTKSLKQTNDDMKHAFSDLGHGFKTLFDKFNTLEGVLEGMPLNENPHVMDNGKNIVEALKFSKKYIMQTHKRIGINIPMDVEKFSKGWKMIKKTTDEFYGKTFNSNLKMKLKITKQLTGQDKVKKENLIRRNMKECLFQLNDVFEEYIHTMVHYHAKSLQTWSNAYSQFLGKGQGEVAKTNTESGSQSSNLRGTQKSKTLTKKRSSVPRKKKNQTTTLVAEESDEEEEEIVENGEEEDDEEDEVIEDEDVF